MKNKDLFTFKEGLEEAKKLQGVKFAYAVAKNSKLVTGEIESLQETIKPSEEYSEFEKERDEIVKKYAKKDKNGDPKQETQEVNGQTFSFYKIEEEGMADYNKDFEELKEGHKEIIEARDKQLEEYDNLLKEDCDIKVHMTVIDLVPENITGETLELIDWMIEE